MSFAFDVKTLTALDISGMTYPGAQRQNSKWLQCSIVLALTLHKTVPLHNLAVFC